jgi:hypothetical protein
LPFLCVHFSALSAASAVKQKGPGLGLASLRTSSVYLRDLRGEQVFRFWFLHFSAPSGSKAPPGINLRFHAIYQPPVKVVLGLIGQQLNHLCTLTRKGLRFSSAVLSVTSASSAVKQKGPGLGLALLRAVSPPVHGLFNAASPANYDLYDGFRRSFWRISPCPSVSSVVKKFQGLNFQDFFPSNSLTARLTVLL